jgi:hypothetical protein
MGLKTSDVIDRRVGLCEHPAGEIAAVAAIEDEHLLACPAGPHGLLHEVIRHSRSAQDVPAGVAHCEVQMAVIAFQAVAG